MKFGKTVFMFVILTVAANFFSCNNESLLNPPFATFVVSPSKGDLNTLFTLNASESYRENNDTTNMIYRWDFENDGIWDTEWGNFKVYYKKYLTPGYYTIGLEVKTPGGLIGWTSRNVIVIESGGTLQNPVATFTVSPQTGPPGTTFTFDASGVTDPQDNPSVLMVRWDFNGDGNWDTDWSTQKTISHLFNNSGTYTIKMQVKDTQGLTDIATRNLVVGTVDPGTQTFDLGFVTIQGGTFIMGCTIDNEDDCNYDEYPLHQVTLSTFQISKYETTNSQYANFLNKIGCNSDGSYNGKRYIYIGHENCKIFYSNGTFNVVSGYENYPVVTVTWEGANAFAQYYGGKLPTEAQWEFAARGGNNSHNYPYSGSNDIKAVAWYAGNSYAIFKEVGKKQPNELGIYDMSGNVQEWCNDWYAWDYYTTGDATDPQGPATSTNDSRCVRGGSVYNGPDDCRSNDRYWHEPETENKEIGFRIVK
jgi:formylglycine-generating enzyme required for sulfatase activity